MLQYQVFFEKKDRVFQLFLKPDLFASRTNSDNEGKWHLSQDGKIKYSYDEIGQMLYTPDGKGFAFQAKKGEKRVVVRDGAESSEYDYAGDLEYSPDSKTLTFMAQTGNTGNLIVNFEPLENSTGVSTFVR